METRTVPQLVDDPGIWFGISTAIVILTFLSAGAFGLGPMETAAVVLIVSGLTGSRLPAAVAVALGIVAWAFFTGFTENTFGQLTFAPTDLVRLGLFPLATLLIAVLVRTPDLRHRPSNTAD